MLPENVSAQDVIAYARELAPGCEYVYAGQGTDRDKDGKLEVDCVGFANVVLSHFDVRIEMVGTRLPYKVRWYWDHWQGAKDTGPPAPGDLIICGNPYWPTGDYRFAHIGIATDPGLYISALNTFEGVKETGVPTGHLFRMLYVLHAGFAQKERVLDMANTYTATATAVLRNETQKIVRVPFPEGRFTEPPVVIPGLLVPVSGVGYSWQKLTLRASSTGVTADGVDVVVNSADGGKVTCTVQVPIVAIGVEA